MIYKKMSGRIGNQFFQYATLKAFKINNNLTDEICLDFSLLSKQGNIENGFFNNLLDFNVIDVSFDKKIRYIFLQKIVYIIYRVICKIIKIFKKDYQKNIYKLDTLFKKIFNSIGLYIFTYGFSNFKLSNKENKIFYGFFESSKYFDSIRNELLNEFKPKHLPLEKNKKLYKIINSTESVCITIRRGDFLSNKFKKNHYICNELYFYEAIKYIKSIIENPNFIIFSDDIKWVKENMDLPFNCHFEDGTDPIWEKLRLMYSCKHFIISNSTFSWWAQYLSISNNKVVVAPSKWTNNGFNRDIYQSNWHLIDIDNNISK